LVGLGATTYGMLATFVKWHTLKIIQQQSNNFSIYTGITGILLINLLNKKIKIQQPGIFSPIYFSLC
jgi:hypothetical protein